jgi:hypothetical protein
MLTAAWAALRCPWLARFRQCSRERSRTSVDGTQWSNTEAWVPRLTRTTDLLGYPLQDVACLTVEKSIPGIVPKSLNHGQQCSRLSAFLTVRWMGGRLRYCCHRQLPLVRVTPGILHTSRRKVLENVEEIKDPVPPPWLALTSASSCASSRRRTWGTRS